MPSQTLTLVDATARGIGLDPLTEHRPKAAVPFAGKFRVIDFTLTNCLHSGVRRILVLTQYKSHSLHKHLRDGWSVFNPELGEFITPIPPQMRSGQTWYAGGVDAVAQNRYLLERSRADLVLLLAGDLIYRMDYAELIRAHRETGAEVTLAARSATVAAGLTELKPDGDGCVQGLAEVDAAQAETEGNRALPAAMGVCVIDKALLLEMLDRGPSQADVGGPSGRDSWRDPWCDLVAPLTASRRVLAYRFGETRGRVTPDRYWCDLAGIDPYYRANMALLETQPPLDLYQEDWTIRTHQGQYPPARTVPGRSGTEGIFVNSMLAAGTVISGGGVSHSILFPRVRVRDGAIVDAAILCDGVQVGEGTELRNCIVEKDVAIPAHARIGCDLRVDRERFTVSPKGVVVVPKGYVF
jgi:glucose-1-phosphate adenylyltransferase